MIGFFCGAVHSGGFERRRQQDPMDLIHRQVRNERVERRSSNLGSAWVKDHQGPVACGVPQQELGSEDPFLCFTLYTWVSHNLLSALHFGKGDTKRGYQERKQGQTTYNVNAVAARSRQMDPNGLILRAV